MKYILFLITLILSSFMVRSQDHFFDKPIRAGSFGKSGAVDSKGNFYFTGDINNAVHNKKYFKDLELPNNYSYFNLGYLIKTDSSYNVQFVKIFESEIFSPQKLAIDNDDNIILAGYMGSSVKIDSFELNGLSNKNKAILFKFKPTGELMWYNLIEGSSYSLSIKEIKINKENEIFIAGDETGKIKFYNNDEPDTIVGKDNSESIYFAKYSNTGFFEWVHSIVPGKYGQIRIWAMELDNSNSIYLTGYWSHGGEFDSVPKTNTSSDIFLAKYNSKNNLEWLHQIGSTTNDITESGNALAIDENLNSIYITGGFVGSADFGNGPINSNDENIFFARYSFEGDLIWVKKMGSWSGVSSSIESGNNLFVDKAGFIYLAGSIGQNGNILGIPISAYDDPNIDNVYRDIFISKFTALGEVIWADHYGHPNSDDTLRKLIVDKNDNLIIVGLTHHDAIFGNYLLEHDDHYNLGYIGKYRNSKDTILNTSYEQIIFEPDTLLTNTLEIVSNLKWDIIDKPDWVNLNLTSSIGNAIITISADTSKISEIRRGTLKISSGKKEKDVIIIQNPNEDDKTITGTSLPGNTKPIIYPNPTTQNIYIRNYSDYFNNLLKIYDINGILVKSEVIKNEYVSINNLPSGIYLLIIESNDKHFRTKIIIKDYYSN